MATNQENIAVTDFWEQIVLRGTSTDNVVICDAQGNTLGKLIDGTTPVTESTGSQGQTIVTFNFADGTTAQIEAPAGPQGPPGVSNIAGVTTSRNTDGDATVIQFVNSDNEAIGDPFEIPDPEIETIPTGTTLPLVANSDDGDLFLLTGAGTLLFPNGVYHFGGTRWNRIIDDRDFQFGTALPTFDSSLHPANVVFIVRSGDDQGVYVSTGSAWNQVDEAGVDLTGISTNAIVSKDGTNNDLKDATGAEALTLLNTATGDIDADLLSGAPGVIIHTLGQRPVHPTTTFQDERAGDFVLVNAGANAGELWEVATHTGPTGQATYTLAFDFATLNTNTQLTPDTILAVLNAATGSIDGDLISTTIEDLTSDTVSISSNDVTTSIITLTDDIDPQAVSTTVNPDGEIFLSKTTIVASRTSTVGLLFGDVDSTSRYTVRTAEGDEGIFSFNRETSASVILGWISGDPIANFGSNEDVIVSIDQIGAVDGIDVEGTLDVTGAVKSNALSGTGERLVSVGNDGTLQPVSDALLTTVVGEQDRYSFHTSQIIEFYETEELYDTKPNSVNDDALVALTDTTERTFWRAANQIVSNGSFDPVQAAAGSTTALIEQEIVGGGDTTQTGFFILSGLTIYQRDLFLERNGSANGEGRIVIHDPDTAVLFICAVLPTANQLNRDGSALTTVPGTSDIRFNPVKVQVINVVEDGGVRAYPVQTATLTSDSSATDDVLANVTGYEAISPTAVSDTDRLAQLGVLQDILNISERIDFLRVAATVETVEFDVLAWNLSGSSVTISFPSAQELVDFVRLIDSDYSGTGSFTTDTERTFTTNVSGVDYDVTLGSAATSVTRLNENLVINGADNAFAVNLAAQTNTTYTVSYDINRLAADNISGAVTFLGPSFTIDSDDNQIIDFRNLGGTGGSAITAESPAGTAISTGVSKIIAGTNVSFTETTPDEITINSTGSGESVSIVDGESVANQYIDALSESGGAITVSRTFLPFTKSGTPEAGEIATFVDDTQIQGQSIEELELAVVGDVNRIANQIAINQIPISDNRYDFERLTFRSGALTQQLGTITTAGANESYDLHHQWRINNTSHSGTPGDYSALRAQIVFNPRAAGGNTNVTITDLPTDLGDFDEYLDTTVTLPTIDTYDIFIQFTVFSTFTQITFTNVVLSLDHDVAVSATREAQDYLRGLPVVTTLPIGNLSPTGDVGSQYPIGSLVSLTGTANDGIYRLDDGATHTAVVAGDWEVAGGASSFLGLSDTPSTFSGSTTRLLAVNSAGDAIEFIAPSGTYVAGTGLGEVQNATAVDLTGTLDVTGLTTLDAGLAVTGTTTINGEAYAGDDERFQEGGYINAWITGDSTESTTFAVDGITVPTMITYVNIAGVSQTWYQYSDVAVSSGALILQMDGIVWSRSNSTTAGVIASHASTFSF